MSTDDGALLPPERREEVDVRKPPGSAGGIPAVVSVAKTIVDKLSVGKAATTLLNANQHDGFDCPGCAWPDPKQRSRLELCENGVKAIADEATRRRADPKFFAKFSIGELAEHSDWWLNRQGRLSHPMVLRPGATHYAPISWDEAFSMLGERLRSLDSPDRAVFYTSGRASNEAAFLYQLFTRVYGTNNLPDCSNMCHESSGMGMSETIGIGKGTVTLEDFNAAELILIFGQNPGTNHPRMLTALQEAKRHGARIVTINPLREPGLVRFKHPQELQGTVGNGTAISDEYLQVKINGDLALLKGIMKAILAVDSNASGEHGVDQAFVGEKTLGWEAFARDLEATPWDALELQSGMTRAQMESLGQLVASKERIIACWAMGLTQHVNGIANIQSVINLLLMRGAFGKAGAGACPVRGHSNVQGDRTMGIWEKPSQAFLDRLGDAFDFEPPRVHGLAVVPAIEAMHRGDVDVFFALGGNFLSATPDTAFTAEALERCGLTVHVATKLNRAHLVTGGTGLLLPCLGRTERDAQTGREQFVTVENSMGIVHSSRGRVAPASPHLLSEPMIIARMAEAAVGSTSRVNWIDLAADYDSIRDKIEATIPGFEDFNTRVRQPGGFALPNPVRDSCTFKTATGRAHFTVHPLPTHDVAPGQYLMMTIRSHDQYNTTIYGLDDRYRGLYKQRRVVFMNSDDMREAGLVRGQRVTLTSHFRGEERVAPHFIALPYDIPRGCTATYFPEANVLVPVGQYATRSLTPASKSVVISVTPS